MTELLMVLDEELKPGAVKHLLKKREILRSIVEDVTQGNVLYSRRFKDFDTVSPADIQHHVKDIPQLEKEVQELTETVNTMAEQRRADRTAMLNEVRQLYGAPLHAITERRRRSLSAKDSKKALPLLLKLVQNLYLEFTTNYKWLTLLKISDVFKRDERNGFCMLLSEAPYCSGTDRQGAQLAAEIDDSGGRRFIGFLLEKLAFMRAVDEDPLGDVPEIQAPSDETIDAEFARTVDPEYLEKIYALKEKSEKSLKRRSEARIPLIMAAHSVFGMAFQLADDDRVNALPLHECKQALQTFVKLAQNLYEEIAIREKNNAAKQHELDFSTLERNLYKDAFVGHLESLDGQLDTASNANDDERKGPMPADQ